MKFKWKIFFGTVLITLLTFGIGGYFLISLAFGSNYSQAVQAGLEENRVIQLSVAGFLGNLDAAALEDRENLQRELMFFMQKLGNDRIQVQLYDNEGLLYQKGNFAGEPLFARVDQGLLARQAGYALEAQDQQYALRVVSRIGGVGRQYYVETLSDISQVFADRQRQYGIYVQLLAMLSLLNGALCFGMALFLTKPLQQFSKAAGKMAAGNFRHRVAIKGEDELADMALDFNSMADSLERHIRELKNARRHQEDFVASFAHELKTPLTSIIGYADMMRSNRVREEEVLTCSDYIFREGKRLEALSLKLLELFVARQGDLALKTVDAREWLLRFGMRMEPVLARKQVDFEVDAWEGQILMEPDLIETALRNLLDNACKAVGEGGRIRLYGKKVEAFYEITVQDNGRGIPGEELEKITEAFYMVDKSRSRKENGVGLGLALCAEIADRHGGQLEFESAPGEGTRARLRLRRAE